MRTTRPLALLAAAALAATACGAGPATTEPLAAATAEPSTPAATGSEGPEPAAGPTPEHRRPRTAGLVEDLAPHLGEPVALGEGWVVGPTADGQRLHVQHPDPASDRTGCEGQPVPILWVVEPATGTRVRALDLPEPDQPAVTSVIRATDDPTHVVLLSTCEEFVSSIWVGREADDGTVRELVRLPRIERFHEVGRSLRWAADGGLSILVQGPSDEYERRIWRSVEEGWTDAGPADPAEVAALRSGLELPSPAGDLALVASWTDGGSLELRRGSDAVELLDDREVWGPLWSPDGALVAWASREAGLRAFLLDVHADRLWSTDELRPVALLEGRLVHRTDDGLAVRTLDLPPPSAASGQSVVGDAVDLGPGMVRGAAPDGRGLHVIAPAASDARGCGRDTKVVLWVVDPATGERRHAIDDPEEAQPDAPRLVRGPEGRTLVAGYCEGSGDQLFVADEAPDGTLTLRQQLPAPRSGGMSAYAWVGPDRLDAWSWLVREDGGTTGPRHLALTVGDDEWEVVGPSDEADTHPELGPQDTTSPDGRYEATVEWRDGDQLVVTIRDTATGATTDLHDVRSPIAWLDGALAYATGWPGSAAAESRVLLRPLA